LIWVAVPGTDFYQEHLKLPKKKQDEAIAEWEEKSKSG
jgi:hypothetical protein